MATVTTISKKIAGFLKPTVSAALQGMSKTDMDEVEFALDAMYIAINTPAEVNEAGDVTHDEGIKHLQVLLASLDVEKTAQFVLRSIELIFSEENEGLRTRWDETIVPVLKEKLGPALDRLLNAKFIEEVKGMRAYAISPGVVDAIIEAAPLDLANDDFQMQIMVGIRSLTNITNPFGPAVEEDTFADAEDTGLEGAKVKIADPFQHEDIDGKDAPPTSSEDEGGSSTQPDGPVEGGPDDDEDEKDKNQMGFNVETFKASCLEATADQIKAGLGDKASDDIKADKWTCTTKEQAAQYNNGAKRHFLPRFNEGSTYLTAGVGVLLGVGGTLVAQSLYSQGQGEVEEDVSNVTPMRGRKTG